MFAPHVKNAAVAGFDWATSAFKTAPGAFERSHFSGASTRLPSMRPRPKARSKSRGDDEFENEAERIADGVISGDRASPRLRTGTPVVQRQEAPEKPREQPSKFPVEDPVKTGTEKDDAEKEKLVKAGLKAAGELAKRLFDAFSGSAEGQRILSANERDWKSVTSFFEDFSKTVLGKIILGAAAGGAAAGMAAGAWGSRDDPSADPDVSPSTGGPVRRSPKDEQFFSLELNWDFVTPPTGVTLKTPWLDAPKIGKSSTSSATPPLGPPPLMFKSSPLIPRICTPADPAGDHGEADARSAFIYGWLKHRAELEQTQAKELLEKYGGGAKPMGPPKNAPSVLTPMFDRRDPTERDYDPQVVKTGLESSAQSLDAATRQDMETAFGHDFSKVRVHADASAAKASDALGANAYTVGRDVVFGAGKYEPSTSSGRRLLAHELAHVVQQGANPYTPMASDGFSTPVVEIEAEGAAQAVSSGQPVPRLNSSGPSVAREGDGKVRPGPPTDLPTGQKVVIQWGDDYATTANAKALATGARSGPNAAGATVVLMENLTEKSLVNVREVAVVIHGESDWNADGTRVIKEGEAAPRAERGLVGIAKGTEGPIQQVTPAEMAARLQRAGFGSGRWTAYRVNLIMCYGGVGKSESYGTRLSSEMAARNVRTEVLGALGRVDSTATGRTESVPPGQSPPRAAARPQPGIPQVEKYYEPPHTSLNRRPGTGWQHVQVNPGKTTAPEAPPAGPVTATPSGAPAPKSPAPSGGTKPAGEQKSDDSKSPRTASAQSAQTLGALAAVAERYVKSGLESISADEARQAALEDFVKARPAMFDSMWNSPGQGMNITFAFMSVTPANGQPARLDYLGMGQLAGDFSRAGGFVGFSKEKVLEIQRLKATPGLTVDDTIVRRLWLKPLRPADPKGTVENSKESEASPALVASQESFVEHTLSLKRGDLFRYELSAFELLKQSSSTMAGFLSNYEGLKLLVAHPVYRQLLDYFEGQVRSKLDRKLSRLNRKMDFYKARLTARLEEGTLSKIINRRGDVPLDPGMFNAARAHLVSAAGTLANGALRHCADSLDQADASLNQQENWLFRYDKGYFPPWDDSVQ